MGEEKIKKAWKNEYMKLEAVKDAEIKKLKEELEEIHELKIKYVELEKQLKINSQSKVSTDEPEVLPLPNGSETKTEVVEGSDVGHKGVPPTPKEPDIDKSSDLEIDDDQGAENENRAEFNYNCSTCQSEFNEFEIKEDDEGKKHNLCPKCSEDWGFTDD